MPDMEKVILALKTHADGCGYRSHHCDAMECPYRYGDESCDIEQMCRDAYELLKEQDAVIPLTIDDAVSEIMDKHYKRLKEQETKTGKWIAPEEEGCLVYDPNVYVQCSACGKKAQYGRKDKYCRNCGAMMEV